AASLADRANRVIGSHLDECVPSASGPGIRADEDPAVGQSGHGHALVGLQTVLTVIIGQVEVITAQNCSGPVCFGVGEYFVAGRQDDHVDAVVATVAGANPVGSNLADRCGDEFDVGPVVGLQVPV